MISEGAKKVLDCFGVRKGESVLIVADTKTPLSIAKALFGAAGNAGCEVMSVTMLPRTRHGEEPPSVIAEAMKKADVVIAPTTFSLTHTQAKIDACKKGARIASMPGITEKMMSSGGMTADYDKVNEIAIRLNEQLENASKIRVTTQIGTDIEFNLEGCKWKMDTGICKEPGCSGNLPAGELYIAPNDANGVFVVDGSMSMFGILDSPLEFSVKKRYVTGIKGKHAKKLNAILDAVGDSQEYCRTGDRNKPESKVNRKCA